MKILPYKTRVMRPPQDNLKEVVEESIREIPERSVVVITSKVVAIDQGRCVLKSAIEKDALAVKESQYYLDRDASEWGFMLTITHNAFLASAGVDESNGDGHWVLLPENPEKEARKWWEFLRKKYKVNELGVVIVDSHIMPLRRGTVGISLGSFGFNPIRDYRGKPDIFGRKMVVATANIPDSLAAAAVLVMGEGAETTPLCLITELEDIEFGEDAWKKDERSFKVGKDEDVYAPFLNAVKWKKGGQEK